MLKQSASDNGVTVDLHKTFQLVCQARVAAFQNSELSSSEPTQSIAALSAAVATASLTKAAEIERLVAESQKVRFRLLVIGPVCCRQVVGSSLVFLEDQHLEDCLNTSACCASCCSQKLNATFDVSLYRLWNDALLSDTQSLNIRCLAVSLK